MLRQDQAWSGSGSSANRTMFVHWNLSWILQPYSPHHELSIVTAPFAAQRSSPLRNNAGESNMKKKVKGLMGKQIFGNWVGPDFDPWLLVHQSDEEKNKISIIGFSIL